jgi:hypothetical protein
MANLTNTAILNLLSTEDTTGNSPINRGATVSFDGQAGVFQAYQLAGAVAPGATIQPPNALNTFFQFYIRNLVASGGSSIVVTVPTNGGGSNVWVLGPGDFLCFWVAATGAPAIGGQSQGGSGAITITSSSGSVPFEYFIGV